MVKRTSVLAPRSIYELGLSEMSHFKMMFICKLLPLLHSCVGGIRTYVCFNFPSSLLSAREVLTEGPWSLWNQQIHRSRTAIDVSVHCTLDESGFVFLSEPTSVLHTYIDLKRCAFSPGPAADLENKKKRSTPETDWNFLRLFCAYINAPFCEGKSTEWPPSSKTCSGCFSCFQIWDVTVSLFPIASLLKKDCNF